MLGERWPLMADIADVPVNNVLDFVSRLYGFSDIRQEVV